MSVSGWIDGRIITGKHRAECSQTSKRLPLGYVQTISSLAALDCLSNSVEECAWILKKQEDRVAESLCVFSDGRISLLDYLYFLPPKKRSNRYVFVRRLHFNKPNYCMYRPGRDNSYHTLAFNVFLSSCRR